MKYLKTYESQSKEIVLLYDGLNFNIVYNGNDILVYVNFMVEKSAIFAMADLIRNESIHLNDKNLRNIKLRGKDIEYNVESLDNLYDQKIINLKYYRTSIINHFIEDKNIIKTMSDKAYIDLTIKYYPIISNAIKESKTLGDIIDKFKIISDDFNKNLQLYIDISKYNI